MTRIVLKNGEIIDTNADIFWICGYISSCKGLNETNIWIINSENEKKVIDINNIKSIEVI